jgi:hypothetical protein
MVVALCDGNGGFELYIGDVNFLYHSKDSIGLALDELDSAIYRVRIFRV